jgi:hypothetical protein
MGRSRVQIQIIPKRHFPENTTILMSHILARRLGINKKKMVQTQISFGAASTSSSIKIFRHKTPLISISPQLAAQLLLYQQPFLTAHFDPRTYRLKLGPLLGILINPPPNRTAELPFGTMTRFLEECSHCGQTLGIRVAIFFPESIRLDQQRIVGWIFRKGKWIQTIIPFPDVIYNRILSRRIEQKYENKLAYLREKHQIPIFNEKFLNKWQVHQILQQDEQMKEMLPETVLFSVGMLKEMLSRYKNLYLKPTNGSLGGGIIRLIYDQKKLIYQSATPNGTITRILRTFQETIKTLKRKIGKQSYLIQQGLTLATFQNRPVDFRVLVQKSKRGEWRITSAVGRIANTQHIVSNLARGGTLRKASDLLKELSFQHKKPTIFQLKRRALEVAKGFERLADGHFAELGIDLAIDIHGKIWLLEINSKPSKTDDSITNPTSSTRPSVYRLMEYTHYLTGLNGGIQYKPKRETTLI